MYTSYELVQNWAILALPKPNPNTVQPAKVAMCDNTNLPFTAEIYQSLFFS